MAQDDEGIDYSPPGGERVARRALILSAVICRANIDHGAGNDDAESLRNQILEWLQALDLHDEIEPWEMTMLKAPLGGLTERQVIRSSWLAEGLAILAWALNGLDLPGFSEKVDPFAVTDAVHFLSMDALNVVRSSGHRSPSELSALRDLCYDIHVALRDFERHGRPTNFVRWVDPAALSHLGLTLEELTSEGDLQIGGQPLSAAPLQARRVSEWIMCERHRAAVWLVGEELVYSKVTSDT